MVLYFSYKTLFIYIVIDSLFTRIYSSCLRHVCWKCRKMFTIKCCYFLVIRVGCSFVSDWLLAIECCRYLFLKLFSAFRKPLYVSLIFLTYYPISCSYTLPSLIARHKYKTEYNPIVFHKQ